MLERDRQTDKQPSDEPAIIEATCSLPSIRQVRVCRLPKCSRHDDTYRSHDHIDGSVRSFALSDAAAVPEFAFAL